MKEDFDWFHLVDLAAKPIDPHQFALKKVKVVCTIGPASEKKAILSKLIRSGMDVARLNFSHGHSRDHLRRISNLREVSRTESKHLGILQDIQGPKIRVGRFEEQIIHLKKGDSFCITTEDVLGNQERVSCTYKKLHHDIKPGHRIMIDDGLVFLIVESVKGRNIHCRVIFGGPVKDSKGVNLPDTHVKIPCLTEKDQKDLEFGMKQELDFVALSFVQTAEDVQFAKRFIARQKKSPLIIAKIESALAVKDIDRILEVSDGIMVARGDLGVECPLEQVPGLQKQIIRAANHAGKFVITATQMLESMTSKPRPTRAEASDVANAVLDGTDAVMLSAETASGDYPIESVKTMSRIILRTEEYLAQVSPVQDWLLREPSRSITNAVTSAAVQAINALDAEATVAFTHSGATASAISKFRPDTPIIALTPFDRICRRLSIAWGVIPHVIRVMKHTDEMPQLAQKILAKLGLWKKGTHIVFLSGTPVARPGSTNLLKVHEVK